MPPDGKIKIVATSKSGQARITIELDGTALDKVAQIIANSDESDVRKAQAVLTVVSDILELAEKPLREALIQRINNS